MKSEPTLHLRALRLVSAILFLFVGVQTAAASSLDRFVRDYRRAWSAPTPVLLLDLAMDPSIFADLTREDRWDHLAFSKVNLRLIRHARGVQGRVTVEFERDQRDRFVQGTYATSLVRERLVVQREGGEYRILRYEGVRTRARTTARPQTWGSSRAGERALMRALEALADHAPDRCMKYIEELFPKGAPAGKMIALDEPFKGSQTARSNTFFVRAACNYMSLKMKHQEASVDESAEPTTQEKVALDSTALTEIMSDLDRSLKLDGKHLLARLLRARVVLTAGDFIPRDQLGARLKTAHGDLDFIDQVSPDLEDAGALRILLEAMLALTEHQEETTGDHRKKLLSVLRASDGVVAVELLARLGAVQHLAITAPELLSFAAELALSSGNVAKASEILTIKERTCPTCPDTRYLRGREAERLALPTAAARAYADVLRLEPKYRDAVWRYASIVFRHGSEHTEEATKLLASTAQKLPYRERTALMILLSVDAGSRDQDEILNMLVERFPNDPMPPFLRADLAKDLVKP